MNFLSVRITCRSKCYLCKVGSVNWPLNCCNTFNTLQSDALLLRLSMVYIQLSFFQCSIFFLFSDQMLDHKLCVFCNGEKNTELGDLISKDEFSVHSLCLFSASELGQHGSSDKDGLLGFWIEDIKETLERSQENKCEYCEQIGATVFCAECQVS